LFACVTVLTAVLAGCASSPSAKAPALGQSSSRYADPLDTPKGSEVACKH
jgi:hypothetical protein